MTYFCIFIFFIFDILTICCIFISFIFLFFHILTSILAGHILFSEAEQLIISLTAGCCWLLLRELFTRSDRHLIMIFSLLCATLCPRLPFRRSEVWNLNGEVKHIMFNLSWTTFKANVAERTVEGISSVNANLCG